MTHELDPLALVLDSVGGDRRVVRNLLNEKFGFSSTIDVRPFAVEQPGVVRSANLTRFHDISGLTLREQDSMAYII